MLEAAGLEVDPASRQVRLNGAPLALTATEFRLLEFLMSRPGVVFSREQLLNSVWGQDRAITDRAVDVYVLRLRQKVESDPANPDHDPFRARLRLHLRTTARDGCIEPDTPICIVLLIGVFQDKIQPKLLHDENVPTRAG